MKGSFDNYVQSVKQSVKQNPVKNGRILGNLTFGEVSELADEHDLGSCAERLGGSSPPFPTISTITIAVTTINSTGYYIKVKHQ